MIKKEQYPKMLIYLMILFLSNLITLFIFQDTPEAADNRPNFIQVRIQAKLKTSFVSQKKVILTNSSESQFINEAYLVEEIVSEENFSETPTQQFVVEIPAEQIDFITQHQHFHIYPYSPNFKQKTRNAYDLTF
ncbi:MAG: hypothetical protein JNM93_13895 [Bacteriovoracaceae bacterium]|nr:hypothetical protein [Bacteriovoracaceae bacterium]